MRKALGLILLLTAAGCSGGNDAAQRSGENMTTFDAEEAPAADSAMEARAPGSPPRPPGISPTAAPGVAFDYRYAFLLPFDRIASVQEQHAEACEKIGVERCRIISMRYSSDGEDEVEAQIAFRLDPALARRFGRAGIDAVERAQGLLTSAEITGEDVGTAIAQAGRSQAELTEELRRIEAQLAERGRSGAERAQLQSQAQDLRNSLRAGQAAQTERRAQLATTPMVFNYRAGSTDRTFGGEMARAFGFFLDSARALLVLLVYALPWLLALLAALLAARWANRRLVRAGWPGDGRPAAPASEAQP